MTSIVIPTELLHQIEREAVAAYPNECCGILFGRDLDVAQPPSAVFGRSPNPTSDSRLSRDTAEGGCATRNRFVERIEPVPNVFDESERFHRFSISPLQLMHAEKSAAQHGQLVIGFYHSHPDHPARPSEYDRTRAWPFYSYVIVSIQNREPADLTSWVLNEQTQSFAPQEIIERE